MPDPAALGRDIDAAIDLLRRVDELMDVAALALPYIEDAEKDPIYKPGTARKLAHRIRLATRDIRP